MKRLALILSLLVAPIAAMAQFVVFTDNFNNGSTTNHVSVPGGTPFASFTSYDIASSKNSVTNPTINPGEFKIQIDAPTSSGVIEAQALFTKNPVTLVNIGDYISLTYIFRLTNALSTTSAYIGQGFYNSGGTAPVPGGLNASGMGTGTTFPNGFCQNWQGYVSHILSNANSIAISRPAQNSGNNVDQALVQQSGVTGGFAGSTTLAGSTNAGNLALITGQYYTISYTITLSDTNSATDTNALTISTYLYNGAGTNGTVLMVMTNVASAATSTYFTNSFDGIAFGRRDTGNTGVQNTMVITNVTISENIFGLPGQPFNVTGGGAGCPGAILPVGLNGSVTSNAYYLYTNGVWTGIVQAGTGSALSFPSETMLSTPLTNTVIASNTVSAFTGPMIGSANLIPDAAPVVTNQPIPVIVANGSIGVFSLGASGGGLTYQWFKNGSALSDAPGHISGSATPTLVISPVGAGDAASTAQGYFCQITSGCGQQTTSSTNSLTIASPASITWQGNNPDTNWDLSVTANFVNAVPAPVVFHNGDNVTFNDNASVLGVGIASSFLAPGQMIESSAQAYTFAGPGVIQGPGSLVMNGPGTLSINNSNAFTGGTTVAGGELFFRNQFALGPGPVSVTGSGTLDIPLSFNSAVGISNNFSFAGTSTLQYDSSGTFACILNGAIAGANGSSIQILGANTTSPGTARLRMYGQFTNNANIALNSGGTEMEIASYNPAGNQLFTGAISGSGGHIITRGAGTITLANSGSTFSDSAKNPNYSVLMSSGNLGIGADSISTTPPTIDSSPVGLGMVGINVGNEGGTCSFFASGGAHTIANEFQYTASSNTVTVIFNGSQNLTLSGEFDLSIPGSTVDTNVVQRVIQVTNTAATTFAGTLDDNAVNGGVAGISKIGVGALYLNGTNTYGGPTTNIVGLLAGSGSVAGAVVVSNAATIGGGSASSIGTFTISNNLALGGNVFVRLNKSLSPAQSNDMIFVTGTLDGGAGTGTVTVTNVGGGSLSVGDKFQIFNKLVVNGGSMTVTGGGMNWNNKLAIDGSIVAASVATGPATNPTNMVVHVSGTNLSITWPGDHLGWTLQMQTNLTSSPWTDVPGSASVTNILVPIVPGTPRSFFRMSLQP